MSRRAIRNIGLISARHPWLAVCLVLALTVVSVMLALNRFRVEMDVAALLPAESEVAQAMRKPLSDYVGYGFLLCVLEVKDDAPEEVRAAPGEFLLSIREDVARALDDQGYFRRLGRESHAADARVVNDAALVSAFRNEDFEKIERMLSTPRTMRGMVRDLAAKLDDSATTDTVLALRQDPFAFNAIMQERATLPSGPLHASSREGYFLSEDGEMMLLFLWPVESSTDLLFVRTLKQFLEASRTGLFKRHPDWRSKISIEFTGPHMENAEGATDVRQDILLSSLLSFVLVVLLFFAAFQQPEALVVVALPLVVGVLWTLGVSSLFVGRITQVTLTFAAILIGLGIDFSVHLYNRFLEGIRMGRPTEVALEDAMHYTGPNIVAGAITTLFAFFGLALTQFVGFRELGIFGGVGILLNLLAMAILLPAIMMIFASYFHAGQTPVATLGLKKVTFTVEAYPRLTVAAVLSIAVFFGWHARHVTFNKDLSSLHQPTDSYIELHRRISAHFSMPKNEVYIVSEDADLTRAIEKNDTIYQRIEASSADFGISKADSLRGILPSARTQRESLERFLTLDLARAASELRQMGAEEGIPAQDFFDPFLQTIAQIQEKCQLALSEGMPLLDITTLEDRALQEAIRFYIYHDFQRQTYRIITRVYPISPDWEEKVPVVFTEMIGKGMDPAPVILGNAALSAELKNLIVTDLARVSLFVFVCVLTYLMIYFRNAQRAMLATVPVFFALICMLGAMQMLGMKLSYINILAIPMIVGTGVDSAIHLLGRFYETDGSNMRVAIERTGRAVVITSLTTIFGFGALMIASFQGVRELGLLCIIGTGASLFASLVFLPAILRLLEPGYTYSGGAGDEIG